MFETIVFALVVMLLLLAALDLFVGVSNDAANFLNSAVGTRIAPLFVVLIVTSVGVITGATFSSGMMEIARKGMLYPEMFAFEEIILIFVAVMIADVILLNTFNSLGLPTSTTVSIIFEILGAATFASVYKIYGSSMSYADIFNYIKLDKTATIVSAILLSVVIAFITGMVVQFISRLLFTFRFAKSTKYLGGLFTGISLSAIFYFLIMKGAKGASFMKPEYIDFMNQHFSTIMWSVFIIFALAGQLMVLLNMNVFKLIILSGTFALAFSFAGNDLVNFVGVPLAALDAFNDWTANAGGDPRYLMGYLNSGSKTATFWLFLSGLIMCVTLWVSKKARQVVQTSINLSSSTSGSREQFGASTFGRIITRVGLGVSRTVYHSMPEKSLSFIRQRYRKPVIVKGEDRLPFDYVRASINLVVSAALISVATSLKLPLSTTYVTFMVAMGSSFADGAWDRESAVYRISGVITVIAGWFLTGICAFSIAFLVNFLLFNLGLIAALLLTPVVIALIIYTNFFRKTKADVAISELSAKNDVEILHSVASSVPVYFVKELECIKASMDAFFDDNEFALRKARNKSSNITEAISLKRSAYYSLALDGSGFLRKNIKCTNDAKFFFYLVFSNMKEAAKSVRYSLDQAVNHVANRHTIFGGVMKASLYELIKRLDKVTEDLKLIEENPDSGNFESIVKHCKKLNRDIDKCQLELVNIIAREHVSMHSSEMYLTFLQCMRDMANRYVAVSMQEHALSEIVMQGKKGNTIISDAADSQAQSVVLASAFRNDRDDLVRSESEDEDSIIDLPKSPAQLESDRIEASNQE
ncbi:MAG: inorganic phosphate transporter [Succinivibrio sp.]